MPLNPRLHPLNLERSQTLLVHEIRDLVCGVRFEVSIAGPLALVRT